LRDFTESEENTSPTSSLYQKDYSGARCKIFGISSASLYNCDL